MTFKWCVEIKNGKGLAKLPSRRGQFRIALDSSYIKFPVDDLLFVNILSPFFETPTYLPAGEVLNCVKVVPFLQDTYTQNFALEYFNINFTDTDLLEIEVKAFKNNSKTVEGILVFDIKEKRLFQNGKFS